MLFWSQEPVPHSSQVTQEQGPVLYEVKFFDDDDFDVFRVRDLKGLRKYAGNKGKLKMIKVRFAGRVTFRACSLKTCINGRFLKERKDF